MRLQIPGVEGVMLGAQGIYSHETTTEMGKTTETSETDTISVDVFVPENSRVSAAIVTTSMTTTIPYS